MLLTLIFSTLFINAYSQYYDFSVEETEMKVGELFRNTLMINIYESEFKDIEKEWKHKLKKLDGKIETKNNIDVFGATMKEIGKTPFNIFSVIKENGDNRHILLVAIDMTGGFVSSVNSPEEYKIFENYLKDFAKEITIEAIKNQLDNAEDYLKDQNKDLNKLEREHERELKNIENWEKDIENSKDEIKKITKEKIEKKIEIGVAKESVNAIRKKLVNIK